MPNLRGVRIPPSLAKLSVLYFGVAEMFSSSQGMTDTEKKYSDLKLLLQKSEAYSSIMWDRIEEARTKRSELHVEETTGDKRMASDARDAPKAKKRKLDNGQANSVDEPKALPLFSQPKLVTGATLKPYQLEGLQWLTSLHSNGISGILGTQIAASFGSRS